MVNIFIQIDILLRNHIIPHALTQWCEPTARVLLVARLSSLSGTHKVTIFNADSQEFTIFWKKSSSISISCPTRHGPLISLQVRVDIHAKKKNSFHREVPFNTH